MRNSYYRPSFNFNPMGGHYFRGAVKWLIIINCAVFVLQNFVNQSFVLIFGLVPAYVLQKLYVWQLVTYLFLHGGFFHLLFNMYAIWIFGRNIEAEWGTKTFVKYYFLTGIGAGVLTVLVTPHAGIPTIGASGAVYGLLVAFAMMFPQAVIYLNFLFPVTARQMVIIFAAIEFFASISGTPDRIARVAHMGGMLIGYLYIKFSGSTWIWWNSMRRAFGQFRLKTFIKKRPSVRTKTQLTDEVNRILDKILIKGPGSLSSKEEEIMKEYSKRKH